MRVSGQLHFPPLALGASALALIGMKMGGPKSQSGHFECEKDLLPLLRIASSFLEHKIVEVLCKVCYLRFQFLWRYENSGSTIQCSVPT